MKRRNPHLVFLSRQVLDIFIALKAFAGGSDFLLPSRYDSDASMSSATLNQVLTLTYKAAQKEGKSLASSGRMTYGEPLARCCTRRDITPIGLEKCLAHEQKGVGCLQQGRIP